MTRTRRILLGIGLLGICAAATVFALRQRPWFEPDVPAGPPTVRLISAEQYANAIQDLFGEDIQVDATFAPPQRSKEGLLSLGYAAMAVTPGALDRFDKVARSVAAQLVEERRRDTLIPCVPAAMHAPDDACADRFFTQTGRLLYRRPLSADERKLHVELAKEATLYFDDFYAGLAHSLAIMMVSPKFLYFSETAEPDPDRSGAYRLNGWSKAERLALFLWNSAPDEELLQAAESGELHTRAGFKQQIDRMLAAPQRVERGTRAFFSDMLLLEKFVALAKDPLIYPAFTPKVALAAQEQILRTVTDHLLTRNGDYRELFTTRQSFLDANLAPLYELSVESEGWTPVSFDSRRGGGLLSTPGFVAIHSHPGRSSPTIRGKAIRESLLCQKVPDPPPNVNFTLFESAVKTQTARERLTQHSTDPVCAGCHKITDPMGLALENFDGSGRFRAEENGVAIDVSGNLDGVPFKDVVGLGEAMRVHPGLTPCLTSRVYAYAVGREPTHNDREWLAYVEKRFASDGYRYPALLRRIAASRAFFAVKPAEEKGPIVAAVMNELVNR